VTFLFKVVAASVACSSRIPAVAYTFRPPLRNQVRRSTVLSCAPFFIAQGPKVRIPKDGHCEPLIPTEDSHCFSVRPMSFHSAHRVSRQSFPATEQFNARGPTIVKETIDFLDYSSVRSSRLPCFSPDAARKQPSVVRAGLRDFLPTAPFHPHTTLHRRLRPSYSRHPYPETHDAIIPSQGAYLRRENGFRTLFLQIFQFPASTPIYLKTGCCDHAI